MQAELYIVAVCRKAKPPRTCHFSTRSRSGRAPKNVSVDVQSGHAKDLPPLDVQWSTVLSIPLPTPSSSDGNPPPSSTTPPEKYQGGQASNDGNAASIISQNDDGFSSLLTAETIEWDTSEWCPATSRDPSVTDEYGDTPENEITFAFETTPTYDMELDFNVNFPLLSDKTPCNLGQDLAAQRPCGIIELSTLLADMAHYETEISMLSGGDLDKYPIGDALFLSQRFSNILSNEIYNKFVDTSLLDAPITLLMLSCYMMLMRILSSVLGHMIQHLLKLHGAHQSSSPAGPSAPSILSYRGLSLGQLQPSAEKDLATRAKWSSR
ncbi:hypothetical protein NQ176_g9559 [Zarea fungicola]|uniref:Uncharacterized protein n=1 Tax=Zarea fungicola TaxID=93591 RepID=A0ACC1MKV0_9HYPO|nr:hypothetical protein NQ176_g9559 [Lecanicillium fungicola]